jgi:hypothetical protein
MGEQFNFRLDPELKKAFGEEEGESEVYEEDAT